MKYQKKQKTKNFEIYIWANLCTTNFVYTLYWLGLEVHQLDLQGLEKLKQQRFHVLISLEFDFFRILLLPCFALTQGFEGERPFKASKCLTWIYLLR